MNTVTKYIHLTCILFPLLALIGCATSQDVKKSLQEHGNRLVLAKENLTTTQRLYERDRETSGEHAKLGCSIQQNTAVIYRDELNQLKKHNGVAISDLREIDMMINEWESLLEECDLLLEKIGAKAPKSRRERQ